MQNFFFFFNSNPYLQWTSIGPHSLIIWSLTMRTNLIKLWGRSGTPKSGQAVKWKCLMGRVTLPWEKNIKVIEIGQYTKKKSSHTSFIKLITIYKWYNVTR